MNKGSIHSDHIINHAQRIYADNLSSSLSMTYDAAAQNLTALKGELLQTVSADDLHLK